MARETKKHSPRANDALPEFAAPPLFETVFGVRFPRLKGWDVRHFGLFWDHVRNDFPKFETRQPLASPGTFQEVVREGVSIQLVTEPEVRCWYLTEDETRLLQVQHDGFFHNWRKVTLDEIYPRYRKFTRPAFQREWSRFRDFLAQKRIGPPQVVECEATYLNHLVKGGGGEWSSVADLPEILKWWRNDGPIPERVRLNASTTVGGHAIGVSLTPVVRVQDQREVLQFSLTVKGRPKSSETPEVMAWMDSARAAIVRGFTDLTTEKMHKRWGRTR